MAENENVVEEIVDEIQTINGIPLCDTQARNKIEEIQLKIDQISGFADHVHEEYITRDEVIETYVNKLDFESILEGFDLSNYVTKTELESKKYLTETSASGIFATKSYVDSKIDETKSYVNNTLTSYATKTYANEIRAFAEQLETRIDALEAEHDMILDEIAALKNK